MKVALLGYGRFGRAFASLIQEAKFDLAAFDPSGSVPAEIRAADLDSLVSGANYVAVAVPVRAIRNVLTGLRPKLQPDQIVFDVGSVKTGPVSDLSDVLGADIPWVATHPLFGPMSLALAERPLRVVVCPSTLHPNAALRVSDFYRAIGCDVIEQTADAHDRAMAYTHALTFFVAKGMLDAGAATDITYAPPSFQAIARTIETVRSDAGHLFMAIQGENPFANEARGRLIDALSRVHQSLATGQSMAPEQGIVIPDLGERSPELKQTRELIDSIDREMIELLRRRFELARRAAQAKATLGRPVIDPAREASLFEDRRKWAEEMGLNPEHADQIFREIVRVGRLVQDP